MIIWWLNTVFNNVCFVRSQNCCKYYTTTRYSFLKRMPSISSRWNGYRLLYLPLTSLLNSTFLKNKFSDDILIIPPPHPFSYFLLPNHTYTYSRRLTIIQNTRNYFHCFTVYNLLTIVYYVKTARINVATLFPKNKFPVKLVRVTRGTEGREGRYEMSSWGGQVTIVKSHRKNSWQKKET